jgi:hypothetical protein
MVLLVLYQLCGSTSVPFSVKFKRLARSYSFNVDGHVPRIQ